MNRYLQKLNTFLFATILICIVAPAYTQPAYFSHLKFDDPNYCSDLINKITSTDNEGNIYVTGEVKGTVDMDPGSAVINLVAGSGKSKAVLAKYNAAGGFEWGFLLGGDINYNNYGSKLKVDPSTGDIIVYGRFQGGDADFDPGPGVYTLWASSSSSKGFLARYTAAGNFVFAIIHDLYDFTFDPSGNIITTGVEWGNLDITKISPAGSVIWQFHLGVQPYGSTSSSGRGVVVDAMGDIIVAGGYSGNLDFDPGPGVTTIGTSGMFIAKYSGTGQLIFVKGINSATSAGANVNDMAIDPGGNIIITGYLDGTQPIDFDPGPGVNNLVNQGALYTCGWDIFVAKYDNNGNHLWAFSVGSYAPSCSTNVGREEGKAITVDANGNIYVTGTFNNNSDFDPGPGSTILPGYGNINREMFVAKYSPSGLLVWAFKIGAFNSPAPYTVLQVHGESISINRSGNILVSFLLSNGSNPVDLDPGPYQAAYTNNNCISYMVVTYVEGKVWNGNADNLWTNPSNWTNGSVPGSIDNVLLPTNGVNNEPSVNSPVTIKNLQVQPGRTLTVSNATMTVMGQALNNGTISNNGVIAAASNFLNNGIYKGTGSFSGPLFYNATTASNIVPGNSPGCMSFSNDFKTKGELNLEINGTTPCSDFDRLNVGGTATVGGKLFANFGYTPTIGQSYQVINAAAYSGVFDLVKATPSWGLSYLNGAVTVIAPLPVRLISFSATTYQTDVVLNWKTIDATNLREFIIERSINGVDFSGIGQKFGVNSAGEIEYSFTDAGASVLGNIIYYRLKSVDLDGSVSFSKIVLVRFSQKNNFISAIYPNPSTGKFTIVFSGSQAGFLDITVTNQFGQVLFADRYDSRGNYTIDMDKQPAGVYFLKTNAGQTFKLIKQ